MEPSAIFSLSSGFAAVAWLFLIAGARWLPRVYRTVRWVVPILLAMLYIALLITGDPPEGANLESLEGLTVMFTDPRSLLAGWIHYLAFDFLIGCWILDRSKAEGIPHWLIVVPMVATFMMGPVGWLMFVILLAVRRARK